MADKSVFLEVLKGIKKYCKENPKCEECPIEYACNQNFDGKVIPCDWDLEEREQE